MLGDSTAASPSLGNECFYWKLISRVKAHVASEAEMETRGSAAWLLENAKSDSQQSGNAQGALAGGRRRNGN